MMALPDSALAINPATGRLAGHDLPAVPIAPTQEQQEAAAHRQKMDGGVERNPATGKPSGLELSPDVAQAQVDALQDEIQAPPESPADYRDPPLPPEFRLSKDENIEFRTVAHDLALGPGQYQQVSVAIALAAGLEKLGVSVASYTAKGETALRKLWGDSYETNIALAKSEARAVEGKYPSTAALFKSHAGSDPTIIRTLVEVAQRRSRQK